MNVYFFLYAEIQDGCQKWPENDFYEKSPVDSADTPQVKNFIEIALFRSFRDKCLFVFYAKIQDSRQKWQENDFGGNLPVNSAHILSKFLYFAPFLRY